MTSNREEIMRNKMGRARRSKEDNNNSVALVRERTIPTERPPLVGEVSTNVCG
jgi:hypothetical protein